MHESVPFIFQSMQASLLIWDYGTYFRNNKTPKFHGNKSWYLSNRYKKYLICNWQFFAHHQLGRPLYIEYCRWQIQEVLPAWQHAPLLIPAKTRCLTACGHPRATTFLLLKNKCLHPPWKLLDSPLYWSKKVFAYKTECSPKNNKVLNTVHGMLIRAFRLQEKTKT